MQDFIKIINFSSRIKDKLDEKAKVIRVVDEYDPLYTDFVTVTVDVADVDLKSCDYKNYRRYQCIRTIDGKSLCEWYQVLIKNNNGGK